MMAGFCINKQGRSYIWGKGIDDSLRFVIIDLIIAEGGIQDQGILEGSSRKLPNGTESRLSLFQNYGKCSAKLGIIRPPKRNLETLVTSSQRMWKWYTFWKRENLPKPADQSKKILICIVLWMAGPLWLRLEILLEIKFLKDLSQESEWQNPLQKNSLHRTLFIVKGHLLFTLHHCHPAEFVFNKLKTVLRKEEFGLIFHKNVHVTVYEAMDSITTEDMFGFYDFLL